VVLAAEVLPVVREVLAAVAVELLVAEKKHQIVITQAMAELELDKDLQHQVVSEHQVHVVH
jgi:hypothetical protein